MYDTPYNLPVCASMMLMVESLLPEARRLLFLLALLEGERLPETLVSYFYKMLQAVQTPGFLLQYNNQEKYLEDRSLVTLHMREDKSTLAAHNLRMRFIREKKTSNLQSIASQILPSSDQNVELIRRGDAEETLVTVLSAMYYEQPFTSVVVKTLENHVQIMNDGVIPRNINNDIDALQLVKARRVEVEELVFLLNVDRGEPDWKRQAHGYATKIIIKLACQGKLDDYSMACLLQLPQTTSKACAALSTILWVMQFVSCDQTDTFSSACPTTMKTLLALVHDNATSTTSRAAAVRPLLGALDFERKDTIVSVGTKLTELLAVDSNPTLQIAIAGFSSSICRLKTQFMICECTNILKVLMGLLVLGKDYNLRVSAGKTLLRFSRYTLLALKIAIIPDALAKLFALFLSKETLHEIPSVAGRILGSLSRVMENRCKFRVMKDSLEGLRDILATMEGTWRTTHKQKDRKRLRQRASIAAEILGELALEKELKEIIVLLPGLEEGLLFLQVVEMARVVTAAHQERDYWYQPAMSTRALTILFSNSPSPRSRGISIIGELEVFLYDNGLPSKICSMADAHVSIYWTRVLVHLETRAYRAALDDLDLAQIHLTQILSVADDRSVLTSCPRSEHRTRYAWSATLALSCVRILLLVMLEDHAGALLAANTIVEKYPKRTICLIERGIVKRLGGDFQGALDDLNLALSGGWRYYKSALLAYLGYVKHLMEDGARARQDAEAAHQLKLEENKFKETIDFRRLWLLREQPINYLGYFL